MKQAFVFIGIFLAAPMTFAAEPLGRLFYTPAQRTQLETARAQRDRRVPINTATESESATPQGPDVVTYSGVVRRSDGKSTVWINGKPVTERNAATSDVSVRGVRRDGAVAIAVPQTDRSAALKVGQSLDVMSGTIEEPYARRLTAAKPTVKPSAPSSSSAAPPTASRQPATRPTRDRDTGESDPDSGVAPPAERSSRK